MTGAAAALFALLLLLGAVLATGALLALQVDGPLSSVERLANAVLLGVAAIGLTVFLVGLMKLDRLTVTVVLAAAYTPLLSHRVRSWLWDVLRSLAAGLLAPMIAVIAVLGIVLVIAIPRPTGDVLNDAIAYHLLGPAVWLRAGRIVPVLDSARTAFPALIESVFAAGMRLSNDRFPDLLGVVFTAVFLGQVYGFARTLGATKGKATLMSFLAASAPAIMSTAPIGLVDVPYASFCLAAVRLLLVGELTTARAAIAGTFLGFALGVKYTAIPLAAITVGVLWLAHGHRGARRALLGRTALVLTLMAVLSAPFYFKNALVLGSPIYPPPVLLTRWFHARAFPIEASASLESHLSQTYGGLGRRPLDLLLLPWRYTLYSKTFGWPGGIGSAPLALGVIGALALGRRRPVWLLLTWSALVTLVWFVTLQQSRFLLHVVGLSFAYAAIGAMWLEREWPRAGRAAVALVALVSTGYGLGVIVHEGSARVAAALSSAADQRLRQREVPYLEAWEYLNREPLVRRVLILEEFAPNYYLTKDYVKIRGPNGERPVPGIEATVQALAHLDDLGVTHVLDVVPPDWSLRTGFQIASTPNLRLVFESDRARVYQVVRGKAAGVRQKRHPLWKACAEGGPEDASQPHDKLDGALSTGMGLELRIPRSLLPSGRWIRSDLLPDP